MNISEECEVGYGRQLPLKLCDIVLVSPIPIVWGMLCGTFPWERHQGITSALWALINNRFSCGAPLSVTGSFTDANTCSCPSDRVLERADLYEIRERTIPYNLRRVSRTSKSGSFGLKSPPPPTVLVLNQLKGLPILMLGPCWLQPGPMITAYLEKVGSAGSLGRQSLLGIRVQLGPRDKGFGARL